MRTFVSGPSKVVWWYNSAYLTSFSFKPVSVSLLQFSWGIQSRKLIFIAVKIKIPSNPACTPYTFNALKTIWILVSLDPVVSPAASIQRSCDFYKGVLGFDVTTFGNYRRALSFFGVRKINLNEVGKEFEPKAQKPTLGSADLCFILEDPLNNSYASWKLGFSNWRGHCNPYRRSQPYYQYTSVIKMKVWWKYQIE